MATKSYTNIDKPVQLVEIVTDNGDGTGGGSGASSQAIPVRGNVADDAAAGTTMPVAVGGIYNTSLPTYTALDRTQAQFTARGFLLSSVAGVGLTGADGFLNSSTAYIGSESAPGTNARLLVTAGTVFNGTSWDRARGNTTGAIVIPPAPWTYAAATGGIDNSSTAVTIKAAAAAGIKNYVTKIQIAHATLGASTELAIRDGAAGTVLWRTLLHTTAMPTTTFDVHLAGTAATLLEVITLTAVTGDVLVNVQGYTAP